MNILLEICLCLFLAAVVVSLFTYSFFWYENSGYARRRAIANSGKSLPKLMIQGVICSIASVILAVVCFPTGFVRALWRPKALSSSQPVIVLVHGLYHNASAWLFLRRRLRKAGFANVFAVNYGSFFTNFEAALEKLQTAIRRCRPASSNQPLIIIGHSLGGLLARVYAERSGAEDSPAVVITLGTPHRGSRMAAFGVGRLAASLMYEGPLIVELEEKAQAMPCGGISLFSPADALVLPAEGLAAPPDWVRYETAPLSHVGMLYSPKIAESIVHFIKK